MLRKTSGIVISYIKYRETSIIVRIFTRDMGLKSYLVNGVRSARSKTKMAYFQPLTLLDLVVYDRETASINRISEAKLARAFQRIPFDFYRSGISMFMGEILGKVVVENYQNEQLFDYFFDSILELDGPAFQPGFFVLRFLIRTSRYLGFEPEDAEEFYLQLPGDPASTTHQEKIRFLNQLLEGPGSVLPSLPGRLKRILIDDWVLFYKIHIEGFGDIKSLAVLRTLLG
ncbi:DNA repair protein RecO [Cyclobacterium xiamenense]|uniref:DNA repair protein RecO n=1 Tax=Cyclobacterium xiamenense TaxID=1297121 RepID=UPI0012B9BE1E|nr:DNA repair protein RecO [Cyclobacterium xiamenense]